MQIKLPFIQGSRDLHSVPCESLSGNSLGVNGDKIISRCRCQKIAYRRTLNNHSLSWSLDEKHNDQIRDSKLHPSPQSHSAPPPLLLSRCLPILTPEKEWPQLSTLLLQRHQQSQPLLPPHIPWERGQGQTCKLRMTQYQMDKDKGMDGVFSWGGLAGE